MSESPQMLTVPRSGRPDRDTMMWSWSSGSLGERRSGEFSRWLLCKERGWRGVLVPTFYPYFSFTLIFSYHKSAGRASPRTSHSGESWKLRQRPPGSGVQMASPFPSVFQLFSSMGWATPLVAGCSDLGLRVWPKIKCLRHLIKTDRPKLKKYHSGQLKDEISTGTFELSRI